MRFTKTIAVVVLSAGAALAEPSNGLFRVTSDRVNLRARPVPDAEVVGQVAAGTVLDVRRIDGAWAQVVPPTNVGVWVNAAFVKEGLVATDRLLVRGGPGATFRDIGTVRRGTRLVPLETRGEWLKCQPPDGVTAWVSTALVARVAPVVVAARTAALQELAAEVASVATSGVVVAAAAVPPAEAGPGTAVLPPGLIREELAAVLGQGGVAERQGLVDRVPIAFLHCSSYRLVSLDGGRVTTVCYLRGNDEQMPSFMGRRLSVRGKVYWLKGENAPLLYPEEVKPLADEPAAPGR